jgi:hypothetical protein
MADPSEQVRRRTNRLEIYAWFGSLRRDSPGAVRPALGGRYRPGGSDPEQIISNRIRC